MIGMNEWKQPLRAILKLVSTCGLTVAALLFFASPNAIAQSDAASSKSTGNVANGKRLYAANHCWECHNNEGQGGNGPRISATNLPLAAVIAYIRHPRGQMPPYIPRVVSDAEVADIYAYLQSMPKPPSSKTIPLLNQ